MKYASIQRIAAPMESALTADKKKRGRPKLHDNKRTECVRIHLTRQEIDWLASQAYNAGHSVSYMCRTRLLAVSTHS